MTRGLFISFEGSEGCGKTTQIERLAERLRAHGRDVLLLREPGGTPLGEQIRHLLKFAPEGHGMCPEAELLLFTASRAELVRKCIEPALECGSIVISDRFLDSTTVYQGIARKLAAQQVEAINAFAVAGRFPDITFLLDLDAKTAFERIEKRPADSANADRMEAEPPVFFEAVRKGYLELATAHPERIRVINGVADPDTIAEQIGGIVDGLL